MVSGIYCLKLGKRFYVGSSIDIEKRFFQHKKLLDTNRHPNVILQRSYNKSSIKNVELTILEEIKYEKNSIIKAENYYIGLYREKYKEYCCNIASASFGDVISNHPDRDKIIEKISSTNKRNRSKLSKEERVSIWGKFGDKNGMFGKTHSPEVKEAARNRKASRKTREKMSNSAKKKFDIHPEMRDNMSKFASERVGSKNPFYGRKHSEETKAKLSEINKGNIPGNSIKISIDDVVYFSFKEASSALGIPHTTIRWRCMSNNKKFSNYRMLEDNYGSVKMPQ